MEGTNQDCLLCQLEIEHKVGEHKKVLEYGYTITQAQEILRVRDDIVFGSSRTLWRLCNELGIIGERRNPKIMSEWRLNERDLEVAKLWQMGHKNFPKRERANEKPDD